MAQQHCLFVFGSLCLTLATIACGISLLAPYWLMNVNTPIAVKAAVEKDFTSYTTNPNATCVAKYRGLWAQCSDVCQWFWQGNFKLEKEKFIPLGWHLATQILYLVGVLLVIFCEVIARLQLCCRARMCVYRLVGFTLLISFVFQAAGVAVFGGFANRDYGASIIPSNHAYLGWCFWMTLAGGALSLLSGVFFLFLDCCSYIDDEEFLK